MLYSPILPLVDLVKLLISFVILHYVTRMEEIKCLAAPSWKPVYIKFYSIAVIVMIIISMFSTPSSAVCGFIISVNVPLGIIMAYAVYTYIRDLEANFMNCSLSQEDKYVHEFLKLYSLVLIMLVAVSLLVVVGAVLAMFPIPKYMEAKRTLSLSTSGSVSKSLDSVVKARAATINKSKK